MIKAKLFALATAGVLIAGPAAGAKSAEAKHESYSVRFYGDKISVKVNAPPEAVEKYLMDGKHLALWSVLKGAQPKGNQQFRKLGDTVRIEGKFLGVPMGFDMVLVRRRPGQEIRYVYKLSTGGMGFLQFNFESMGKSTKITKKAGNEMSNPFLGDILDALKFTEIAVRSGEKAIVNLKAHFDPSVSVDQLLEEGIRGEVYDKFFQAYRVETQVKAPAEELTRNLSDADFWKSSGGPLHADFGCLTSGEAGACPAEISLFGELYPADIFVQRDRKSGKVAAYFIFEDFISRAQLSVKPGIGRSKLILDFATEVPAPDSAPNARFLKDLGQLPDEMEKVLVNIRNAAGKNFPTLMDKGRQK